MYQEFAPLLSSTITQLYHCHAWDWMKPLQWLYVAAISKWGNIYFLFTLICFSDFSIIPSFWGIAYNISRAQLPSAIMDVGIGNRTPSFLVL